MRTCLRGFWLGGLLLAGAQGWAAEKPSLLIASPHGAAYGYVDLNYLRELHQQGFEVDYTDGLQDLTWERVQNYNVLVVYTSPDAWDVTMRGQPSSPAKVEAFVALMEQFLDAGGGVFLMVPEYHMDKQMVAELTDRWGAKLPVEIIVETDPEKVGPMSHSCQETPLAFTDQVLPSPVSEGVKQIWYPLQPAYNGGMSGPIWVDDNWQVVVKASPTAVTKPVDTSKSPRRIANPFVRPEGVAEPPLMAIRDLKAGRVALICQWQQFSLGSGTKWIFNREVLEKGLKGQPSDFGRLLQNTFRWLAEPSLKGGTAGGYVTAPERLQPPNAREEMKQEYAEKVWPYDPAALSQVEVPAPWKLYRGLIGAQSAFSSGTGTVEEYAQAAQQSGLDFVIFLEDFARLTPEKFAQLKAECRKYSGDGERHGVRSLLLLPGFHITNNLGNRMFFYGPDPVWPLDLVLTGPNKSVLYIQEEDGQGNFTGYLTPYLDWVLGAYHVEKGQVGYYDFTASPHGMRLHDCRLYAAAGVRYYRNGQLVEDLTDEYLTTAQCTIPPAPMSVNEVASPAELLREVESGHALTYAQAESLDPQSPRGIFQNALRWSHQYDSLPVFLSDGPLIHAWNGCHRVWTYGGEEFVRGPAVMPSPIAVTAEKGLREIRIYNGEQLFRRFLCHGDKEFHQVLVLDGTIQKNLVLIAEDVAGGKAVSFARRCWKDGALAPSFCSDHVNDGQMFLAHGPYYLPFNYVPALSPNVAGDTWDGGPPAAMPLSNYQDTLPVLDSDQGPEEGFRLDQIPVLEFSDEGAVAVATVRREAYEDWLKQVVNPWHTYGPIAGPSQLFANVQRYRQYVTPTVGVPDSGWAAPGVRAGVNASLFLNEIQFKQDLTVKSLRVGMMKRNPAAYLVLGGADGPKEVDLEAPGYPTFPIRRGEWFGFYGKGLMNAQIFCNRGETLHLKLTGALELHADLEGRTVKKGDRYTVEWAVLGFPLDVPVASAADLQRYVAYLQQPTGLQVLRGQRLDVPGLVELAPDNGAVELSLPKPAPRLDLTLPVRIQGLNPRWSAGLFQKQGYSKGFYGPGENRYRALGLDFAGHAYVPLYVDYADTTHVVAGHPIVAGPEGQELFIQVTHVGGTPDRWHVAVNNPTDRPVTTTLRAAMALPGLDFPDRMLTLKPGEYVVIQ